MAFNPTKTLANIFRRYVIDGNPASGENKPRKSEIAIWGTEVEAKFNSVDLTIADKLDAHPVINDAASSANPGDSFVIDAITVDEFGHVTDIGTRQVTSTATTATVTNYPRGWPITVLRSKLDPSFTLNETTTLYVATIAGGTTALTESGVNFTQLEGTWRSAGYCGVDLSGDYNIFLFIRID